MRPRPGSKVAGTAVAATRAHHFDSDWIDTDVGLRSASFLTKLSAPAPPDIAGKSCNWKSVLHFQLQGWKTRQTPRAKGSADMRQGARQARAAAVGSGVAAALVVLGLIGAWHAPGRRSDRRLHQLALLQATADQPQHRPWGKWRTSGPIAHSAHKQLHDEVFEAMRRSVAGSRQHSQAAVPHADVASPLLAALQTDEGYAAADALALAQDMHKAPKRVRLRALGRREKTQSLHSRSRTQSLNVPHAKSLVFPNDAAPYGADGGGSGYRELPSGSTRPVQASAQWEYPGFVCYDPNGCDPPEDPDNMAAEAAAESYADDPSYYGDHGVDDQEEGSPWHEGTPYRGSYMHATFPYENEPTGFFAGYHTMENSGLNVGMGKHRDVNSYFYPDAVRVTTGDWHYKNYDLDGSYRVPEVDAFGEYDGTLPVLNPVTGREQYTVPGTGTGPDPREFSGVGSGMLWGNRTREGGGDSGKPAYTGNYFPFASN